MMLFLHANSRLAYRTAIPTGHTNMSHRETRVMLSCASESFCESEHTTFKLARRNARCDSVVTSTWYDSHSHARKIVEQTGAAEMKVVYRANGSANTRPVVMAVLARAGGAATREFRAAVDMRMPWLSLTLVVPLAPALVSRPNRLLHAAADTEGAVHGEGDADGHGQGDGDERQH
eukprot:1684358-Pleurochrysis_carterae.AAC.1